MDGWKIQVTLHWKGAWPIFTKAQLNLYLFNIVEECHYSLLKIVQIYNLLHFFCSKISTKIKNHVIFVIYLCLLSVYDS